MKALHTSSKISAAANNLWNKDPEEQELDDSARGVLYARNMADPGNPEAPSMQNQTDEVWLIDSSTDGTGVFVFPENKNSEFGNATWDQSMKSNRYGQLQKAIVSGLTYQDCVSRGERDWILGYKWVPTSLVPYDTIVNAAISCSSTRCVRRCARYGCICIAGECK